MSLCNTVEKEELDNFFLFIGNVPREQINELYKIADYYIISSDFEGTPISMLEAMFNKVPIIGSDVSGINSVLDENRGLLFNNKDVHSLVNAIKKLLEDDDFAKLIIENSYNYYIENFNYNFLIEEYKKIL